MSTTDATAHLSMTTRVVLGASLLRDLAPHLHGLDLYGLTVAPRDQGTRVRIQTATLTGAADLIDRLRNDPSCVPDAGDGELYASATHTHLTWECEWDGYPVEVCACEPLINDSNDINEAKEQQA